MMSTTNNMFFFFTTLVVCFTCTAALVNQPVVYEISTRPWLYTLSNKYGKSITLDNIPASEFKAIADLGVDVVWVWSLSAYVMACSYISRIC